MAKVIVRAAAVAKARSIIGKAIISHATLLLLAGENVKVVSERLGHANIKSTLDTCAHVLPTMQKAAADRMQSLRG